MRKNDYIEMLIAENINEDENQKSLFADVIDCVEIALSQTPDEVEINNNVTSKELYELIKNTARSNKKQCVGPFEAAEIIAKKLNVNYVRAAKRLMSKVNLEDFL